jgi:hypothetical protein
MTNRRRPWHELLVRRVTRHAPVRAIMTPSPLSLMSAFTLCGRLIALLFGSFPRRARACRRRFGRLPVPPVSTPGRARPGLPNLFCHSSFPLMWLCTQLGFNSIVSKEPETFHIRARCRENFDQLAQTAGTGTPISFVCRLRLTVAHPLSSGGSTPVHERPDQQDRLRQF